MPETTESRRPLKSRQSRWARELAKALGRARVRPNWISIAGVIFAGLAAAFLVLTPQYQGAARSTLFVAAAAAIQLRLLANLMDGMVAIEGGMQTKLGLLFNDLPDRLADALILVAAGYAVQWVRWGAELGWAAALLALMTAYVRLLGGAMGATQWFIGPMAKQHRMAVLTTACLLAALEAAVGRTEHVITAALAVVSLGSVATLVRRLRRIITEVQAN
jgi:phosphatidylglycerophosphate synthase